MGKQGQDTVLFADAKHPKAGPRICLRCSIEFESAGPGNRICGDCHRAPQPKTTAAERVGHAGNGQIIRKGLKAI